MWRWAFVGCNQEEQKFKSDLKTLLKILKNERKISTNFFICQLADYMEKACRDARGAEAIYAYLDNRANFAFTAGLALFAFLAEEQFKKDKNYRDLPEVQIFAKKWIGYLIGPLEKLQEAAEIQKKIFEW